MDRRSFIRFTAIGTAAGVIAPQAALAATSEAPSMAGGLYYTKEAPGRWSKKVGGHLPTITVSKGKAGTEIEVVTAHGMSAAHFIVKHIVLNDKYEFIAEKMFDLAKDKAPISKFDLGGYTGQIHVLSVCNKHDTWLNSASV